MITVEKLLSYEKCDLQEASKNICQEDLAPLVDWLSEKDDDIRYRAFLILQYRSKYCEDIYPYLDVFYEKLRSTNSYQRSIGLMLIAANAKWDRADKLDNMIEEYLALLNDEKPITVRQCIQSLCEIVPYKQQLLELIAEKLMSLDISSMRETMQKLILVDILTVLAMIQKHQKSSVVEQYVFSALTGGLLDKKSEKLIKAML